MQPSSYSTVQCAACKPSQVQGAAMQFFNYIMQLSGQGICRFLSQGHDSLPFPVPSPSHLFAKAIAVIHFWRSEHMQSFFELSMDGLGVVEAEVALAHLG